MCSSFTKIVGDKYTVLIHISSPVELIYIIGVSYTVSINFFLESRGDGKMFVLSLALMNL